MILKKFSCVVFHYWVLSLLFFIVHGDGSEVSVKFLKTPNLFSCLKSATFLFEVLAGENVTCTDCSISCKVCKILHICNFFFWATSQCEA